MKGEGKMNPGEIFQAAELGDADEVREWLVLDPTLANAENQDGLTVLGIAAHYGHREVVEVLLAYRADVNALSRGANPNLTDSHGYTPLQIAIEQGHHGLAELLRQYGANE
jgi:ankyrin repeat protein